MSFRAIFFDIDGTLLGRDKRMPSVSYTHLTLPTKA